MLGEGVHGVLPGGQRPGSIAAERLAGPTPMQDYHQLDIWHRSMEYAVRTYSPLPGISRAKPLAS
jgi:hypothetical protein